MPAPKTTGSRRPRPRVGPWKASTPAQMAEHQLATAQNLTVAQRNLLIRTARENRPVQANALPSGRGVASAVAGAAAKAAPKPAAVSPWVRLAQAGKLAAKDMTRSTGPRADVYGAIPRSANPIGPISQAQKIAATLVDRSDAGQTIRNALKPQKVHGPQHMREQTFMRRLPAKTIKRASQTMRAR